MRDEFQLELDRRRAKEKTGPRSPGQDLKNLPLVVNLSINYGKQILDIIKKIDQAVKWDAERNVPSAILNQVIPDDDNKEKVEKEKQEDIKKYKQLKNKVDSFEKSVTPQLKLSDAGDVIAGALSSNNISTVVDLSKKSANFW